MPREKQGNASPTVVAKNANSLTAINLTEEAGNVLNMAVGHDAILLVVQRLCSAQENVIGTGNLRSLSCFPVGFSSFLYNLDYYIIQSARRGVREM